MIDGQNNHNGAVKQELRTTKSIAFVISLDLHKSQPLIDLYCIVIIITVQVPYMYLKYGIASHTMIVLFFYTNMVLHLISLDPGK